VATDMNIIFCR